MITLSQKDYLDRVTACWLGKNIGGTVGAPFEWKRQINDVSFYTQELGGDPLPNDDLDIQLLWLVALEERGIDIDTHILSEYWCLYVTPHWAEYGMAKVNLRMGLPSPLSGNVNNEYRHSCGAFIRSEIWACITPGLPELAAWYARQDAMIDHGSGEGTVAEIFTAAMESAAFVVIDLDALLDIGLSFIPKDSGVAKAVACARQAHSSGKTWQEARNLVLENHRGSTFYNNPWHISEADKQRGFGTGVLGYDAPSNIGMLTIALLYGKGSFDQTMCIAVNCGEDTDCTAATAGSIFGIIHGTKGIPERWITPIGRTIKTACLNLGELGYFGNQLPANVDNLTTRTLSVCQDVLKRHGHGRMALGDSSTEIPQTMAAQLCERGRGSDHMAHADKPTYRFPFFDVELEYLEGPEVEAGVAKRVRVTVINKYKVMTPFTVQWHLPEGWSVAPGAPTMVMSVVWRKSLQFEATITPSAAIAPINRCTLEMRLESRPTVMHVPVVFLHAWGVREAGK